MSDIALIQLLDEAPPGLLAPWAAQRGLALHVVRPDRGEALPVDARSAVVLGSDDSVNDGSLAYNAPLIAWAAEVLRRDMPMLGICFGAQLMARALGARVYKGAPEIGFAPVTLTIDGARSSLSALAHASVLHWHADTFDHPEGATHLASTPACAEQAFSIGATTLALQFHAETGDRGFERWLVGHAVELANAGVDVVELRGSHRAHGAALTKAASVMLSDWIEGMKEASPRA